MRKGLVQVFWGNGKGKTTSALGTALRACGSGFKVHLVQFMKDGAQGDPHLEKPGEIIALEKFDNFSYKRFGTGKWLIGEPTSEHFEKAKEAMHYLRECFDKDYEVIIADEILYSVQFGLLQEDDVIRLIDERPSDKELILTGSHKALLSIFEKADLVTECRKVKHPYDKGILARKGLEY